MIVRLQPVVARPAVQQVGAALALEVVVAVLAEELDAVSRGVVVVGLGEVVAVAEVDDHRRIRPGAVAMASRSLGGAPHAERRLDADAIVERRDEVRPGGDVAPVDREEVGFSRVAWNVIVFGAVIESVPACAADAVAANAATVTTGPAEHTGILPNGRPCPTH